MPYTTADKVRAFTDLTDKEVTDEELAEHFIPTADSLVELETGQSWTETDTHFNVVSLAATYFVAALVYKKLLDSKKSKKYYVEAKVECKKLKVPVGPVTFDEQ